MAKNSARKIGSKIKKEDRVRKKSKAGNEENVRKKSVKEKFAELLELPKELMLDLPRLTLVGSRDMMIENYKNVMEYGSERIRLNTGSGTVKITGAGLLIKEITSEDILISGDIRTVEFL